jgi:hypothetical protein
MTLERFQRIADDPDLLRTITYEELKTLALAYPYAHNLRYLLAIKARQTDHQDAVKNIATAATFSLNRTQLFRLVAPQMLAPQELWVAEEVLELKPIETLKRKLEEELSSVNRTAKQKEPPAEAMAAPTPESEPSPAPQNIPTPEPAFSEEFVEEQLPKIPYLTFGGWFEKFKPQPLEPVGPSAQTSSNSNVAVPVAPEAESPTQELDYQETEEEFDADEPSGEIAKKGGIAQILAEKSVAENKDVISETLAKLYAKQGYREKAITMYERLCLVFPEKSAYFAAEIDKLKK